MEKRPIYIIAHRCNTVDALQEALEQGANAIECDVRWGRDPNNNLDWFVEHDGIDSESTKLDNWLKKAKEMNVGYPYGFALILFDIKDNKGNQEENELNSAAIAELRKRSREHLPNDLKIIFSLADFSSREKFSGIIGDLKANEGLSIDYHNKPQEVQQYFADMNHITNFWYGNGISAAIGEGFTPNIKSSIKNACALRNADKKIKKVYIWTLEKESSIREMINEYGVDGVLVNRNNKGANAFLKPIADTLSIIKQNADLKIATRADNPFVAIPNVEYTIKFHTSNVNLAGTDANIDLTIRGSKGTMQSFRVNPLLSGNAFEKGQTDTLTISKPDVGELSTITLKSDGANAGSDWHLHYVEIKVGNKTTYFPFDSWINKNEFRINGTKEFPYQDYTFTVKTTKKAKAGTDSNITLTVAGSRGFVGPFVANRQISGNAFESGNTDTFTLKGHKNIGDLRSISVVSDLSGSGSGWHLDYIQVNGKTANFKEWIEDKKTRLKYF